MNIVMIDSHAEIERGGAIQCARLAATLAERGHQLTCVFDTAARSSGNASPEWVRMEKAGVKVLRRSLKSPAAMRRFWRELDEIRPDIVHTHKNGALYFLAGATLNRRKFGWVANRGTEYSLLRELPAWAIHRFWVDRMIPVADAVKDQLVRDGIPERRLRTIYGSFDVDRFDPSRVRANARDSWGVAEGVPLIGMAASFKSRKKGQSDFLQAAARVIKEFPGTVFVLAGDGPSERWQSQARDLGIAENVRFPGFVTDMPAALAAMDVAVCASTRGEGLTGSVREALAMARPVVSTNVAGNGELVRDGETGRLVPPRDAAALAGAITQLLADRKRAAAMGAAGRKLVLQLCTDSYRAARVEELYRDLLAERAGP